ncbi:MAG: uracil-DNA glycosylase family protein [Pseudomonadota bacterium]
MTREDAYKMTREDVLRELELLPVWTLRAPILTPPIAEMTQPALAATLEEVVIETAVIETQQVITSPAVFITSDDKKWLFVLPAELTSQAADLFNNILRALHINKTQTSHSQQLAQDIASLNAGVIVAMGEVIAQQLLDTIESIEGLRGKVHLMKGQQVIVTYHPNEILQHLPNKAKTWDDLCSALDVISR